MADRAPRRGQAVPRSRGRLADRAAAAWSVLLGRAVRESTLEALLLAERQRAGTSKSGGVLVNQDTAMQHSAVWAALRLRANLISSLPLDVHRVQGGVRVEVSPPPVLVEPWPGQSIAEFLYATQWDLDRYGNVFGVVRERDRFGVPTQIELLPTADVRVTMRDHRIARVRYGGTEVPLSDLWHERQYTPPGSAVGLSPIQAAARSIGGYLAAQEYALDWYEQDGAHPVGTLRNTEKAVVADVADEAKRRFKAATANRDVFVTGKDWEWTADAVAAEDAGFLEQLRWGSQDVARFLDVPGDVIDAATPGGTITYANVTQRFVQLLVLHMGPAIARREATLTKLTSSPRFVKLNSDALLRMDPQTRAGVLVGDVAGRVRAPSEVRALYDLPPFTDDQLAEFDRLFGARTAPQQVGQPSAQQAQALDPYRAWEAPR